MKKCDITVTLVPKEKKPSRGPLDYREMVAGRYYTKANSLKLFESGRYSIYKYTGLFDEKRGVACICYSFGVTSCEPYLRWSKNCNFYEVDIEKLHISVDVSQVGDNFCL